MDPFDSDVLKLIKLDEEKIIFEFQDRRIILLKDDSVRGVTMEMRHVFYFNIIPISYRLSILRWSWKYFHEESALGNLFD